MRPFETLHSAKTPDGTRLSLHHRDGEYFIHLDGEELMSTRRTGSESALAALALRTLPDREYPKVLIGGLGFGYTLRAALEVLPNQVLGGHETNIARSRRAPLSHSCEVSTQGCWGRASPPVRSP